MDDDDEAPPPPPVVFVHRVDTYLGRILAQHLGTSLPGVTLPDLDPPERPLLTSQELLDAPATAECFKIIGSLKMQPVSTDIYAEMVEPLKIPVLDSTISSDDDAELLRVLDTADVYVFHLNDDDGENGLLADTQRIYDLAERHITEHKLKKTIVLVSHLLSWGKTRTVKPPKPTNAEGAEEEDEEEIEEEPIPYTEADAKKRKAHDDYKPFLDLEKQVAAFGRKYKRRVSATVIGAGVLYGMGENFLHGFFKDAWHNKEALVVPGDGKNHLLMIHVRDLVQIVQNAVDAKPLSPYILAIDDGNHTLGAVLTSLSKELTTGEMEKMPIEEALQKRVFNQLQIDILTTDLLMEPVAIKENMLISWLSADGFIAGRKRVVKEYRQLRKLTPIKLAVLGPPFSGKTTLAKRLCDYYKLHYVTPDNIVETTEENMHAIIEYTAKHQVKKPTKEDEDDDEEEEEPVDRSVKARQLLAEMETSRAENSGKVTEDLTLKLVREKLMSRPSHNQGYVLDGYPDTKEVALKLFALIDYMDDDEDYEEEQEELFEDEDMDDIPPYEKKLAPDFVFYLNVTQDVLQKRKMAEPHRPAMASPIQITVESSEADFTKRIAEDKVKSTQPSALGFFDEIENYAVWLTPSNPQEPDTDELFIQALRRVGKSRNYGLTREEKVQLAVEREEKEIKCRQEVEDQKRKLEEKNWPETERRQAEWKRHLQLLRTEDYAQRELQAMPAHEYLLKYALPTVHESLLECARIFPEDPVDFVAEYLLQKCRADIIDLKAFLPLDRGDCAGNAGAEPPKTEAATLANLSEVDSLEKFISETAHIGKLCQSDVDIVDIERFVTETAHVFPDLLNDGDVV